MAQRMETPHFEALHRRWYQAPIEEVVKSREEPSTPAARRIEQQEGASFAAFSGMFQQVAAQTQQGR